MAVCLLYKNMNTNCFSYIEEICHWHL